VSWQLVYAKHALWGQRFKLQAYGFSSHLNATEYVLSIRDHQQHFFDFAGLWPSAN
jgi:hypothetical protein